jgi:hypothetical protein
MKVVESVMDAQRSLQSMLAIRDKNRFRLSGSRAHDDLSARVTPYQSKG